MPNASLDYKRVKTRQRYLDRLPREQRRMPLFSRPLMPLAAAHALLASRAKEVAAREKLLRASLPIIADVPF